MLWIDNLQSGHKLLFHGAKSTIEGALNVHAGRANNDLGQGFYAGESYEQAISFIDGEITDEQCKHCLAATHLGSQYVFIREHAIEQVKFLERCYISNNEKAITQRVITFYLPSSSSRAGYSLQ